MAQDILQEGSVRERIQRHYGALTLAERRIADHLSHRYRELVYANASQIARELDLAPSTIVRFAQKLGFDGYPALRSALQGEFQAQHRLTELAPSGLDFLPDYVRTEMENVAFAATQAAEITRAAQLLADADRVWVTGNRASHFTAGLAHHFLRMIRPDVRVLDALPGDYPDVLLEIAPGDVAWVVSMSRYSRRTFRVAEHLYGSTPIVLMSDEHASPLLPFATVRVRFATNSVTSLRSDVGAIATMQALVMAVAQRTVGAADRLKRAEDLWRDFGVFYTEVP